MAYVLSCLSVTVGVYITSLLVVEMANDEIIKNEKCNDDGDGDMEKAAALLLEYAAVSSFAL